MGLSFKVDWGPVVLYLVACCALLHGCSAGGSNGSSSGDGLEKVSDQFVVAGNYTSGESWEAEKEKWVEYNSRRYFYVHNETRVAMAKAEAEVARRRGPALSDALRLGKFPDFVPPKNGCVWDIAHRELSFFGEDIHSEEFEGFFHIQTLAVDSCAERRTTQVGYKPFELCSQRWVESEKRGTLIQDNPDPATRSLNVLVKIRAPEEKSSESFDVIGDGVYFPATGQMHLVGCIRREPMRQTLNQSDFVVADYLAMNPQLPIMPGHTPWIDPDTFDEPPLNLSKVFDDCAVSVTVQYPPVNCRWNKDRVLNYTIRSQREKDDPLYFDPKERTAFNAYYGRVCGDRILDECFQLQRRLETGGQILLLVLGLVCVALQMKHGRHNEEALPFVSLAMLGIQLANHVSQTSIFQDLQIVRYMTPEDRHRAFSHGTDMSSYRFSYDLHNNEYYKDIQEQHYGSMMLTSHIPYQAMAMTAIFMYVWIFHRVGDRRRIMKVRVLRKRLGAKDPPSEWPVTCATLAFFSILCFLGFFVIRADQHGHVRRALTGMSAFEDRYIAFEAHKAPEDALFHLYNSTLPPFRGEDELPFAYLRFYELSGAHWSFINKLTGLVVSLFLVPQLMGNMQWDVHGPLSAWFYIGIPFLQSLPHVFTIAGHFEVLPIFSFFDPYLYSPIQNQWPWWPIGMLICSTLQVLALHSQLSRSQIHSTFQYSRPRDSATQIVGSML